jgi:hypothetical protein
VMQRIDERRVEWRKVRPPFVKLSFKRGAKCFRAAIRARGLASQPSRDLQVGSELFEL